MTGSRALAVGLDGVPYWLLRELADTGVMPVVAALLEEGALRPLRAPVPDISSTSWASFCTGADPGSHGVYGFVDLRPGEYTTYFPNLRDLKAPPLWQAVSQAGHPSLILNVPGTYPAPTMHGTLVSGFVVPDFDRAVHPAHLRQRLLDFGYQPDVEVGDVAERPAAFLDRVEEVLQARRRAFDHLLRTRDWRVAVCVITETDRVHHFLWRDLRDPDSPLHARILDFYRKVDTAVGELAAVLAPDEPLMLLSDHGFGPASVQFRLNAWLRERGHLRAPGDSPGPEALGPDSTAFALDPGRVYLNEAGRFPKGARFGPAERERILADIDEGLRALRWTPDGQITVHGPGQPLVAEVLRGPETYHGPHAHAAPDLVVMPAPGVQVRGAWQGSDLTMESPLTGTHTQKDALLWCRGDSGSGPVDMRDAAPTLLAMAGVPPGSGFEGRDVRGTDTRSRSIPSNQSHG